MLSVLIFDFDFYFWKEGKILSYNPESQQVDIEILSSLPGESSRKESENLGFSFLHWFLTSCVQWSCSLHWPLWLTGALHHLCQHRAVIGFVPKAVRQVGLITIIISFHKNYINWCRLISKRIISMKPTLNADREVLLKNLPLVLCGWVSYLRDWEEFGKNLGRFCT